MALEDGLTVASKGSQSLHIVLTIVSGNLQKFRDGVSGYDDSPQLALGDVIALLHVATALHCYLRPDTFSRMESISHSQKTR